MNVDEGPLAHKWSHMRKEIRPQNVVVDALKAHSNRPTLINYDQIKHISSVRISKIVFHELLTAIEIVRKKFLQCVVDRNKIGTLSVTRCLKVTILLFSDHLKHDGAKNVLFFMVVSDETASR
jgi:hypothetical protein